MKANHFDYCPYCRTDIEPGVEIVRANPNPGNFNWAHATCRPVAGGQMAAGFRVLVVATNDPSVRVGEGRQFVGQKKAINEAATIARLSGNAAGRFTHTRVIDLSTGAAAWDSRAA